MESEAIIRFVLKAPSKSGCYVRKVVIDDDTTTPARLKEDKGKKKSKGRLPKHLAGILCLADHAHRKRTWRGRYYKIANVSRKKSMLTNGHAKKMGIDIGHWLYQVKSKNLHEIQELADVPLRHWCGDHSKCDDSWCVSKKIATEGKVDNQKPLFDMSYELDRMTVERVRKEQDEFTTPKRLKEINHEFSTQLNESLNMAIGRGAPKYKHFSRSQSIYYRIAHVIITHNLGIARFVHRLFNLLNITPTTVLVSGRGSVVKQSARKRRSGCGRKKVPTSIKTSKISQ